MSVILQLVHDEGMHDLSCTVMSDTYLDGCLNFVYRFSVPVTIYGHNKIYFASSRRIHLVILVMHLLAISLYSNLEQTTFVVILPLLSSQAVVA